MLLYLAQLVAFTGSISRMLQVEPKKLIQMMPNRTLLMVQTVCSFKRSYLGQKDRLPVRKARPAWLRSRIFDSLSEIAQKCYKWSQIWHFLTIQTVWYDVGKINKGQKKKVAYPLERPDRPLGLFRWWVSGRYFPIPRKSESSSCLVWPISECAVLSLCVLRLLAWKWRHRYKY